MEEFEYDPIAGRVETQYDLEHLDVDFSALGQVLDTTWGRSSTPKVSQHSVKFDVSGHHLVAKFGGMVRFGSRQQMIELKRRYDDESIRIISAYIANIKKQYKELSGKALKLKELTSTDSFEHVGMSPHSPCRTACYRRQTVFELL